MAQSPVRFCESCENYHGSRYYTECEQFFCKSCELSHLKSKSCRNHIFKDTDIVNPEVKTPVCKQHGEKFNFYCNTCISLICNICLTTTHQKHDFCLIDDVASKTRPHLDMEVKSAEASISRAKQQIISSRLTLKNFKDETEKVKKNIEERVAVVIKALNATKHGYMKSVEEHKLKEVQKMNKEIMKIEKETENGVEVLEKMKSLIDGQNNIVLMDTVSKLTNTLQSFSLVSMGTVLPVPIEFCPRSRKLNCHNLIGNLTLSYPNGEAEQLGCWD